MWKQQAPPNCNSTVLWWALLLHKHVHAPVMIIICQWHFHTHTETHIHTQTYKHLYAAFACAKPHMPVKELSNRGPESRVAAIPSCQEAVLCLPCTKFSSLTTHMYAHTQQEQLLCRG
eukprot:1159756-Pelagomonas_calceolata.AAC.15